MRNISLLYITLFFIAFTAFVFLFQPQTSSTLLSNKFARTASATSLPKDVQQANLKEYLAEQDFKKQISNYSVDVAQTFTLHEDKIDKGQFLSDILLDCNVPYQKIAAIANCATDVFAVQKLQVDKNYTILCEPNTNEAQIFIYHPNKRNYVVYDLRDTLNVYTGVKPITTQQRTLTGVISSSLFESILAQGGDLNLGFNLTEVYAWTVDFFRLQKGDKYKIVYEEQFVDGEKIGSGKILAAYFEHFGQGHYAYQYQNDTIDDYFDENGEGIRKQFLKAPLRFNRISSRYTKKRFHPVLKRYKSHLGTDYAAPKGTPVMSTADGRVIARGYTRGNGNYVKIKHNGIYTTQYLHLSKFAKGLKVGDHVKQSDIIGYVGSTGLATGPHLCYRFWKHGAQVDPFKEKVPPAYSIPQALLQDYFEVHKNNMAIIDNLPYPTSESHNLADTDEEVKPISKAISTQP